MPHKFLNPALILATIATATALSYLTIDPVMSQLDFIPDELKCIIQIILYMTSMLILCAVMPTSAKEDSPHEPH